MQAIPRRWSIAARMRALVGLMLVSLATVAALTAITLERTRADLRDMQARQVQVYAALRTLGDTYAVTIVDTVQKLRDSLVDPDTADIELAEALRKADGLWKVYIASPHASDDVDTLTRASLGMELANRFVEQVRTAISTSRLHEVGVSAATDMYAVIDPLSEQLTKITSAELRRFGSVSDSIDAELDRVRGRMLLIAGVAGAIALFLGWVIVLSITRPVGDLVRLADRVAEGDLHQSFVASGRDETSQLTMSVKRMADRLLMLLAESRELASRDTLTGAYNRRAFLEIVAASQAMQKREREAASVLLVDLDHFKRVNDTWGHNMGDAVLKHAAGVFRASLRDCDVLCRWGGEEFIVLLPRTDLDGAVVVADRMREALPQNVPADWPEALRPTASIGAAPLQAGAVFTDVAAAADAALYRAKAEGRNRVMRATA